MRRYLEAITLENSGRTAVKSSCEAWQSQALSTWVQLVAPLSDYSHSQAMLLCRHSEDEWVAWIPDYGEAILHISEFYFDSAWN